MIERIERDGILYALVVRREFGGPGRNFLTEDGEPLQFCILQHPANHSIPRHVHRIVPRTIEEVQEVLHIEYGVVLVKVFTNDSILVGERMLIHGDTLVLLRGAHSFKFLQDTKVIYVKQGPYLGKAEDKVVLEEEDNDG